MEIFKFLVQYKKKIINILLYFIGVLALKGASFLLTPIYTRVFSTAEYGTIELGNTIISFVSIIIGLGLCQYLGIEYFHFKDRERTIAIEKNLLVYFILVTPLIVVLSFINGFDLILIKGLDRDIIFLVLLQSFFVYFSNLSLMLCKNQGKTTLMTLLQLVVGLITFGLNIMGVCYWGWGIYSIFVTGIISGGVLLFVLPFIYHLDVNIKDVSISYDEIVNMLKISTPLAITGLINSVLLLSDRWILNYYCSTSEIGIYSLATKFSSVFEMIIINTLTIFYSPYIYQSYQNNGIKVSECQNRSKLKWYMVLGGGASILFCLVVSFIFPIFVGEKFSESENYLWIILIGDVFWGATYFRTYLINYQKRTKSILNINLIALIFNFVANIVLIPKYHIWAAAVTTTASYIVMFMVSSFINQKVFRENVEI